MSQDRPSSRRPVSRRSLLAAGLTVPAAGFLTAGARPRDVVRPASGPSSGPAERRDVSRTVEHELRGLERRHGAVLAVYAVNTRTGATVRYRPDRRIAFCSTFKALAASCLLRDHGRCDPLDRVIHYPPADVITYCPVTSKHVATGMTVGALAAAAIRYSDACAGNLLLREAGGPPGLTAFVRSLGDRTFRSDRWEPELATAVPGDPRDTTTATALGRTFGRLMLGDALRPRDRKQLVAWMAGNTTSSARFRAGLPRSWRLADKTGTGDYGVANDVGVAWTAKGTPLLLSAMTTRDTRTAPVAEALVADAARVLARALAPGE